METYLPTYKEVHYILWRREKRKRRNPKHAVGYSLPNDVEKLNAIISSNNNRKSVREAKFKLKKILAQQQNRRNLKAEEIQEAVTERIINSTWDLSLNYRSQTTDALTMRERRVFYFKNDALENMVLNRIISDRLKAIFQISPSNRDRIIRSAADLFRLKELKCVILRTDFKDFFNKVSHESIQRKLNKHAGVPHYIKQYINTLLDAYLQANRRKKRYGLPTGLPISSVLAEIVLEDFDNRITSDPNVVFYARFVDDIILILNTSETLSIERSIEKAAKDLNLELHSNDDTQKIAKFDFSPDTNRDYRIDYLGYCFQFEDGVFSGLDISDKKRDKFFRLIKNIDTRYRTDQNPITALEDMRFLFLPHYFTPQYGDWLIKGGLALSAKLILECPPASGNSSDQKPHAKNLSSIERCAARKIRKYTAKLIENYKQGTIKRSPTHSKLTWTLQKILTQHQEILKEHAIHVTEPDRIKKVFEL